ncbi:MAG: hypothetical protein QOJ22_1338 [Thermoleophilaceae bacterium]|jgi:hypothetical protein|nr:hypothetical protein [Thermoleophilaceae bacterium]
MATELQNPPTPRPPARLSGNITDAVLIATAAADDGGPAAALPFEGATLLERLAEQLRQIGIPRAFVITRPEWEDRLRAVVEDAGPGVTLHASEGLSEDLARVAQIARERRGGLVIAAADVLTQRGALERLLSSPGVVTGGLSTAGAHGGVYAFRARTARGRVVSAASAYHSVAGPRASFLSVLKVAAADNAAFAALAEGLSALTSGELPEGWASELEQKVEGWRLSVARNLVRAERRAAADALEAAGRSRDELPPMTPYEYAERKREVARALPPDDEAELVRRVAAAREDAVALLFVGLVRSGVHVGLGFVRGFFWARPLSRPAVESAALGIEEIDEERVLLNSAVKRTDGFFTTFFVSTWSRYIARAAARAGLTPNQVTVIALCIGLLAAAAFATGERAGYIAGAVLLYLSFVADCVDGQLARYTGQFSKFGAWLDSVFDRAKEYAAFAGLGIGAASGEVWVLAGAALTLQTLRHSFDFSYGATDRQAIAETPQPPLAQGPDVLLARSRMSTRGTLDAKLGALRSQPPPEIAEAPMREDENGDEPQSTAARGRSPLARRVLGLWRVLDRRVPGLVWVKKMLAFPIGERFAVICVTAALWDPRVTFIALLSWGGFALVYTSAGRVLRSIAQWRALPR